MTRRQAFLHIALPLARSGVMAGSLLAFAHTIGEFGVVLMLGGNIPGVTRVASIALYDQAQMLNLGWRFDYQILTSGMRRFVRNARLPRQPRFSQHAPLVVDYDWTLSL